MKAAANGAITVWFGLHLHHHFHGPPVDYVGLAAASVASWIGVPGPGESVLVAAGIFAAKHKLDIAEVLLVAWVAATAGGIAGWLIGMRAGRAVMTAPGPLQRARQKAVERGDEIFGRVPVLAVVLTPSWIAGIHRVRTARVPADEHAERGALGGRHRARRVLRRPSRSSTSSTTSAGWRRSGSWRSSPPACCSSCAGAAPAPAGAA